VEYPPFNVEEALDITRDIAKGLGAAHACGIVHEYVNPDNILMGMDPEENSSPNEGDRWLPKLIYFDVSGKYRQITGSEIPFVLATASAYAAPEQWRKYRRSEDWPDSTSAQSSNLSSTIVDGRTDLYALGGVLFKMLTGKNVFDADNYEGWKDQHCNIPPRAPSVLCPDLANWKGLDALVLRLLAKDREQRPKNAAELIRLLDAIKYHPAGLRRETVREEFLSSEETVSEQDLRTKPVSPPIPDRLSPKQPPSSVQKPKPEKITPRICLWIFFLVLLGTLTIYALFSDGGWRALLCAVMLAVWALLVGITKGTKWLFQRSRRE
jgi:serine/threonine protein kinase